MKNSSVIALFLVVAAAAVVSTAEAACVPTELAPCLPAITGGSDPTADCCKHLKEQEPCFCQYLKDPNLRQYVSSPQAKKVASECGVSFPKCS